MKTKFIIAILLIVVTWNGFSQIVSEKIGINPTMIASSAALELESTSKGFLPPRVTFAQRNAISSPVTGLIVYCTDYGASGELQVFNGTVWTNVSGTATIGTVPTSDGRILKFMSHNLGADITANPLKPSWRLNGAYFQWGKKPVDTNDDSYRTKPSNGVEGFAAAPSGPGAGQANDGIVAGWTIFTAANGSWNVSETTPVKTANDPCPNGYRVPTRNEWVSIYSTTPTNTQTNWSNVGTFSNSATNYSVGKMVNNSLFLPASGFRGLSDGALNSRGEYGKYWSSTESFGFAMALVFTSDIVVPNNSGHRLEGYSVRCVEE